MQLPSPPTALAVLDGSIAISRVLRASEVVLYLALPFDVYTLAWIWHGISNEDMLSLGLVPSSRSP